MLDHIDRRLTAAEAVHVAEVSVSQSVRLYTYDARPYRPSAHCCRGGARSGGKRQSGGARSGGEPQSGGARSGGKPQSVSPSLHQP